MEGREAETMDHCIWLDSGFAVEETNRTKSEVENSWGKATDEVTDEFVNLWKENDVSEFPLRMVIFHP